MKTLAFTIMFAACTISVSAQKLIEVYKKGVVKLVPDPEYGTNNDWDQVFKTYPERLNNESIGSRKSLKIIPDGSVVVNHSYHNYFTKFKPDGKFEKEFGIKNSQGQLFQKNSAIEGIINNNIFFTGLDLTGNIICFDLNGNYIKTLKLDYMSRQMIPLPDSKIAVVGWAQWSTKFRDFVAIVDYETNKQKVIWEHFTERTGNNPPPPPTMTSPQILNVGNKIIIAIPSTGAVLLYDLQGNLISQEKIDWDPEFMTVEEQKEMRQKTINQFKDSMKKSTEGKKATEESILSQETMIKKMEADMEKITKPMPLPYFSTIIKDSDGNLLFFEYPKAENANKFNVWIYENNGKFVCQSSLVCDEYNLEINSSKMVFHNGYIYGLQLLKNASGIPLRLVRFKITSN